MNCPTAAPTAVAPKTFTKLAISLEFLRTHSSDSDNTLMSFENSGRYCSPRAFFASCQRRVSKVICFPAVPIAAS